MECNKEEAIRAMDIAKRKVAENDYNGAKLFANKAQDLYPKLDGLRQVMMLIDVYISAGNKIIGGESDWYGILGVDPLADEEVVKKQYKRLALLLHPDKNNCEGAEGAFKLVLAAWCLLSDKVKRIAYDQKRKLSEVKPKRSRKQKQPPKKPPKQPPNQQKQPPNEQKQPPNQQKQPPNEQKQPPNQPKQPPNQPSTNGRARSKKPTAKVPTFWTMCNKCGTQYEYVRVYYLNKTVLCRNCRVNFKATEKEKTATEKKETPTEKEETSQATKKNTNGASSCNRDSSLTVNVGSKREVRESEEKDEEEEAGRGIANSDLKVEERVFKKLRTDNYAESSSGIKV
ncbi:Chaperone J-domain superfamily [Arabidopsis suecica]|uniref:Chaperone J-domain superfamily n=1 Tax=Arabidopsis suecica TaxID=45249 RepID=A0A8T1YLL5_ARASU|nr:Chaperone J-domain superfamily [Arabidopsis suecica]